ncbi:MAG: cspA2, partial [Caulobacteraceae bacterium]
RGGGGGGYGGGGGDRGGGGGGFRGGGGGGGGFRGGGAGGGGGFDRGERAPLGPEQTGVVKFFNGARGFGFVTPDDGGADVFVHVSAVERAGLPPLEEGQKISFQTLPDPKGKGPKAVNLKMVE